MMNENEPSCKCNKVVTSAMPLSHHLSSEDSKNSINFFLIHSSSTNHVALSINDYYVTLPIHSHPEVTVEITNLGIRIFAIFMLIRMNLDWGMD